ncbi:SDR family oxidoreductase [Actinomadura madurae]|uniref:SDR family oxidoreductase n=1 Tax=Actinomadura madurae TaxID=1993 RepID=UPI000D9F0770|nr:SDR family oxidoreductase [Actinomadura madurae]SPT59277.1 3-oxoacyl-[acyl-carrier-protein] reductase FabG [Actinomadura madurae]
MRTSHTGSTSTSTGTRADSGADPGIRTALVGGGAGGIGAAAAAALLRSGHRVVLAGRTRSALAEAGSRLGGDRVDHLVCDLAEPAEAAAAADEVRSRHGALDVLVLSAGGPAPGRVLEVSDAQWRTAMDLLLLGPLALMRAALPGMAARGFGRVVLITSTAVRQPQPELAASTVLRSAVTAAAKLASREYADRGVTVNCVAPGTTLTPRRLQILQSRADAAGTDLATAAAEDQAEIPAGRSGDPDEVAAAIAFLASAEASYINGTVLAVDGGRTETV